MTRTFLAAVLAGHGGLLRTVLGHVALLVAVSAGSGELGTLGALRLVVTVTTVQQSSTRKSERLTCPTQTRRS